MKAVRWSWCGWSGILIVVAGLNWDGLEGIVSVELVNAACKVRISLIIYLPLFVFS